METHHETWPFYDDAGIRLGSHGTDNGWAHYNNTSRNFSNIL